jgi:ketosteroid isomerase-like protein
MRDFRTLRKSLAMVYFCIDLHAPLTEVNRMKNAAMSAGALLILGCAVLCSSGCTQGPSAAETKAAADAKAAEMATKDVADIKALEDRFIKATATKDVNAIMAFYVPDASLFVFDVTPPRQHVGAADYRKDWEDTLGLFPGPIEAGISDVDVTAGGGDIAYGHSIQTLSGTMKNGKKMNLTVRITDGYKRVNGQWLIAQEHVSVPVDLVTGKGDLTSKP